MTFIPPNLKDLENNERRIHNRTFIAPRLQVDFSKEFSIAELVRQQKDNAQNIAEIATRTRALKILDEARKELRERLSKTVKGTFTEVHLNAARAQVETVITELCRSDMQAFGAVAQPMTELAVADLVEQVQAGELMFKGISRKLPVKQAMKFVSSNPLNRSLLQNHANSIARYGYDIMGRVERELSISMLARRPAESTIDSIASIIDDERWKAERIWRTELADTYETGKLETAQWANEEEGMELRKQLQAYFDARTGEDSKFVHGQAQELDEPFEDNRGRKYMKPPNRPNDRETVMYVDKSWKNAA